MARIERFTSKAEADLACGLLSDNGIPARVSGDDVGGVHPDIPFGIGGTAVVVPDDRLQHALALLDESIPAADLEAAAREQEGAAEGEAATVPAEGPAGVAPSTPPPGDPAEDQATAGTEAPFRPRRGLRPVALLAVIAMVVGALVVVASLWPS
jgi:hypothetical protein